MREKMSLIDVEDLLLRYEEDPHEHKDFDDFTENQLIWLLDEVVNELNARGGENRLTKAIDVRAFRNSFTGQAAQHLKALAESDRELLLWWLVLVSCRLRAESKGKQVG